MIELCCEYLPIRCIWLYDLAMSRTHFRVNLQSKFAWTSKQNSFEQGVPSYAGKYRVRIHSEMRTWHGKNMQYSFLVYHSDCFLFIIQLLLHLLACNSVGNQQFLVISIHLFFVLYYLITYLLACLPFLKITLYKTFCWCIAISFCSKKSN